MHERALRLTYSAYTSTSQELLDKDFFVEVYSEHCQTSKKECFAKIVNGSVSCSRLFKITERLSPQDIY